MQIDSSAVMKSMNQLVSIPELAQSMTAMAREMERVGLIEEVAILPFVITITLTLLILYCR